jgi:ATP:ADP antiporter, AAA family
VGAQSGKSIGSVLQQVLLIASGGSVGGVLPILAIFYFIMLARWKAAVADLAEHYDPSHAHRLSVLGSLDEEDDLDVYDGTSSSSSSSSGGGGGLEALDGVGPKETAPLR